MVVSECEVRAVRARKLRVCPGTPVLHIADVTVLSHSGHPTRSCIYPQGVRYIIRVLPLAAGWEGNTCKGLSYFTDKSGPESGPDCLIYAKFGLLSPILSHLSGCAAPSPPPLAC